MTAPDTNHERQAKRHAPSLIAMLAVVVFAVGLIGYWAFSSAGDVPTPASPPAATEAPAGTVAPTDPAPTDPAITDPEPDLAPPAVEPPAPAQ